MMTKEEKKKSQKQNKVKQENKKDIQLLKDKISSLEKELKEKEEILKNTQLQYISLKNDFDLFTKRVKQQEEKTKQDLFEKNILSILPILELFELSYEHIPEDLKSHKWTEGLSIINKKINSFLKDNGIETIKTLGKEVDETLHEVIQAVPVDDEAKKGKIIKEVKKGYILKNGDKIKVLSPAKVIIGQ